MGKIPDNAKRVFEGKLFDVYQWEQEMFDGSTAIFEKVTRIPSVQLIVVTENKKLILLNEEQPFRGKYVSMPGGMVEKNETHLQAAKKELLEELGMKAKELILWKEVNFGDKVDWPCYYYIAKGCKKVAEEQHEVGEKIEPLFVDFDEFIEMILDEKFKNQQFSQILFKLKHTVGLDKFKEEVLN